MYNQFNSFLGTRYYHKFKKTQYNKNYNKMHLVIENYDLNPGDTLLRSCFLFVYIRTFTFIFFSLTIIKSCLVLFSVKIFIYNESGNGLFYCRIFPTLFFSLKQSFDFLVLLFYLYSLCVWNFILFYSQSWS